MLFTWIVKTCQRHLSRLTWPVNRAVSALLSVARKRATVLSSSLSYETAHECAISNGIMPNDNRILAEEVAWQEIEVPL